MVLTRHEKDKERWAEGDEEGCGSCHQRVISATLQEKVKEGEGAGERNI